ncbi:MAG: hypothetical protein JNM39_17065 [Bdellovibrionaceae bacterium]|nr:hypothetical protein [Pseudobdellovibrionaceae bacterium]
MNSRLRRTLKQSGETNISLDDAYFERLHDRIMKQIDATKVEPVSQFDAILNRSRSLFKLHAWSFLQLTSAAALFVIFCGKSTDFVQNVWSSSRTVQRAQNDKKIVRVALQSPEGLSASFISFQKDDDFLMEVAANSMNDLSRDQFREFIGQKAN